MGVLLDKEDNLLYEGNNIIGTGASLKLNGDVNTQNFGVKYPQAPRPGQRFMNTSTKIETVWNGTAWI